MSKNDDKALFGKLSPIFLREDAYSSITLEMALRQSGSVSIALSHSSKFPSSLFSKTACHHKPLFFWIDFSALCFYVQTTLKFSVFFLFFF